MVHFYVLRLTLGAVRRASLVVYDDISITQSKSNFYGATLPGEAELNGSTAESMFHSNIDEAVRNVNRISRACWCLRPGKRGVLTITNGWQSVLLIRLVKL